MTPEERDEWISKWADFAYRQLQLHHEQWKARALKAEKETRRCVFISIIGVSALLVVWAMLEGCL